MRQREYDEDDVRVRPARSSRPRTRTRPRHADAVEAMVTAVHLGRYVCVTGTGTVTAMRARELGRRSVVVGDRVWLVGDVSGAPDALARIVRIGERRSELRRSTDDDTRSTAAAGGREALGPAEGPRAPGPGGGQRAVVANADQLVIVSALADPPPRTGFIDRCLVAAYHAGIDPLLCLTKADLVTGDPAPLAAVRDYYAALDLPYVLCRPDRPLDELWTALHGRLSVLIGHSGVGKSTLVNRLVPEAARAVGAVSAVGKGRHTSSSAVALPLPAGSNTGGTGTDGDHADGDETGWIGAGWIIDTPGIRSFGLAHVSADDLLDAFTDLVGASAECPRGCDHMGGSCALDGWVATGHADPRRLASYRRLLASRTSSAL